ncbi:hypothetical protein PVAP13_7NG364450 [Panicum virgatum]|uniref:Uncharacterized protein n=1 Tax=Panicum virgatum TaxID=38727 RepID=A0A8T0Q706_PANVG|nr:hypothetical protein PVAP13_7NG364450 [Panicum virgatum]
MFHHSHTTSPVVLPGSWVGPPLEASAPPSSLAASDDKGEKFHPLLVTRRDANAYVALSSDVGDVVSRPALTLPLRSCDRGCWAPSVTGSVLVCCCKPVTASLNGDWSSNMPLLKHPDTRAAPLPSA